MENHAVATEKDLEAARRDLVENLNGGAFGPTNILKPGSLLQEKWIDFPRPYRLGEISNPRAAKRALGCSGKEPCWGRSEC